MPLETTPPALDLAAAAAIATELQTAIDALVAFNINLTKEERQAATSVGPQRTAFMIDYFGNKDDYATLKPPFMNETDAQEHWDIAGRLLNIKTKAAKVLELVDDIKLNSEHFAYQYALEGYATVQRGKEQNVPGADTFNDLLSPYFDKSSGTSKPDDGTTTDPNPPTEPTPPTP